MSLDDVLKRARVRTVADAVVAQTPYPQTIGWIGGIGSNVLDRLDERDPELAKWARGRDRGRHRVDLIAEDALIAAGHAAWNVPFEKFAERGLGIYPGLLKISDVEIPEPPEMTQARRAVEQAEAALRKTKEGANFLKWYRTGSVKSWEKPKGVRARAAFEALVKAEREHSRVYSGSRRDFQRQLWLAARQWAQQHGYPVAQQGSTKRGPHVLGYLPHPAVEYLIVEMVRDPKGSVRTGRVLDHAFRPTGRKLTRAQQERLLRQAAQQEQAEQG